MGTVKSYPFGLFNGSRGLPFAVNCMENKYLNEFSDIILIGPWQKATFKVNLLDYFMEVNKGDRHIFGNIKNEIKNGLYYLR